MNKLVTSVNNLEQLIDQQKLDFNRSGAVSAEQRQQRIQTMIDLLVKYHKMLVSAMDEDFSGRPAGFSLMNDVLGSLSSLKHARDNFQQWMNDEVRKPFSPYDQLGAEAIVKYQPKGSVGIIGTWNAPLYTMLAPLAYVLAAGNRAILKPSEIAPKTAEIFAESVGEMFDPLEVAVVTGGTDIAQAFTAQAFDHLVYTGSSEVGKKVMRNAADNLVPLTLELGGKTPTIIGQSADLETAAFRLAVAKGSNAGQLCVNPDMIYVPHDKVEDFVSNMSQSFATLYPSVEGNSDLVSVVNVHHFERIEGYLDEAKRLGTRIEVTPAGTQPEEETGRCPLRIVIAPPKDCQIMQQEIFGPAVIVLPYDDVKTAVADINSRPRPLALYYFGTDMDEQQYILDNTLSGGVSINEAMFHAAMLDAPFGGVGASGMGCYQGREGFNEFSHIRTIYKAPDYDPRGEWGLLPPYSEHFLAAMESQVTP